MRVRIGRVGAEGMLAERTRAEQARLVREADWIRSKWQREGRKRGQKCIFERGREKREGYRDR